MPTSNPQTIAIFGGTGQLGSALALRWAYAGHRVLLGSRTADKAQAAAVELNAELGGAAIEGLSNLEAAAAADIGLLAVEQSAHAAALEAVREPLAGKILIDATARLSFPDLTPPAAPAAAQLAQQIVGQAVRVVAAFQTVPAAGLRKDIGQPVNSDVLVCAANPADAEAVITLAGDAGLRGYYVGGLDKAIVVEGLTSLLVAMNKHYKSRHGAFRVAGIKARP